MRQGFLVLVLGALLGALGAEALLGPLRQDAVYILCLHHVAPVPKEDGALYLAPDAFHELLEELRKEGVPCLSLEAFRQWRGGFRALPPVSVLLTFDDGYEDNGDRVVYYKRVRPQGGKPHSAVVVEFQKDGTSK